jgi:hypothetical protein
MRLFLLFLLAGTALARAEDPIVAEPLPPADTTRAPAPAPTQASAVTPWLPKDTALLQALDKVNARSKLLTVKVGQSATFGSLTIAVKACDVRPPDVPADATAFLTIADNNAKAPGFSGWMLKATPSVSMLAHPIYDVRVVGCT